MNGKPLRNSLRNPKSFEPASDASWSGENMLHHLWALVTWIDLCSLERFKLYAQFLLMNYGLYACPTKWKRFFPCYNKH